MTLTFVLLVVLIALSGLFSGSEIAYFSLSPARFQTFIARGTRGARRAARLRANPQRLLTAILLGNNLINTAAASVATALAFKLVGSAAVGIATGVMTFVILVFGEVLPKSWSIRHAETLALSTAPFLTVLERLVRPLSWLLGKVAPGRPLVPSVTEEELRAMTSLGVQEGTVEQDEARMIRNVFRFNDITAEDVMTPRSRMQTASAATTVAEARPMLMDSRFSRIPLTWKDAQRVTGILYKDDVLRHLAARKDERATLDTFARPVVFVPETKTADDLLRELQNRRAHMAVVVNEYGEVVGIVTMEDLLEELVGEIIDEHDVASEHIKRISKSEILVAGTTDVRKINDFFNTALDEEFTTVAGLLEGRTGRIPQTGERVTEDSVMMEVVEADATAVHKVRIIKEVKQP